MDIKVKQRLVGACVLVGLAAVLLPVVFHGGDIEEQNIKVSSQVPTPPAKPPLTQIVFQQQQQDVIEQHGLQQQQAQNQQIEQPTIPSPLQVSVHQPEVAIATYAQGDPHPGIVSDVASLEKPQVEQLNANTLNPTQKPISPNNIHQSASQQKTEVVSKVLKTPAAKTAPQAWIIQVASLSNKKQALILRTHLRKQGYAAYLQHLKSRKGDRYRVLVGPMIKKIEAEKILAHLSKTNKVKAIIISWVTPSGLRVT